MHSNKTRDQFIQLRIKGWSLARIAAHIGVAKCTLVEWSHEHRDQIETLRAVELEELTEKTLTSYSQELERLTRSLTSIENEIAQRKFADLSTDKLFTLGSQLRRDIQLLQTLCAPLHRHREYMPSPGAGLSAYLNLIEKLKSPQTQLPPTSAEPANR